METPLQRARTQLGLHAKHWTMPADPATWYAINAILEHLEALETSSLAKQETPSSSEAIETQEDGQSTSSTYSELSFLAKGVTPGGRPITATVTFHGPSFTLPVGGALKVLQLARWTGVDLTMSGSQWDFGSEPLSEKESTPEVNQDGRGAGGDSHQRCTAECGVRCQHCHEDITTLSYCAVGNCPVVNVYRPESAISGVKNE